MRKFRLASCIALSAAVLIGCGKEDLDKIVPNPNLFSNGDFETATTGMWSTEGDGSATTTNTDPYEGTASGFFHSEGCLDVVSNDFISVANGKMYELSFAVKMNGSPTGCATEFQMTLHENGEDVLNFNLVSDDVTDWTIKKYYFTAGADDAVSFDFLVGIDSLWLDDIEIKEMQ